jgi:hypothetical protein
MGECGPEFATPSSERTSDLFVAITPLFFLLDCLDATPVPPTLMLLAKTLT